MKKEMTVLIFSMTLIFVSYSFAQAPDLILVTGAFSPSIVGRGELLSISATVQNAGNIASSRSHLMFYLSKTAAITDGYRIACTSIESLAAGASSELKQVVVPVPTILSEGVYFVGWVVDPYDEVSESDENNGFYLPGAQLTLSSGVMFSRHLPYPIIFLHGWNSNDLTWNLLKDQLDLYGWASGGRMDYCLNYDGDLSTSLLSADVHDFTNQIDLQVGDYYTVNFDVDPAGVPYGNTVESNQSAAVKQGKAVQSAIQHVLAKTGADKVILVGHSMGGLAEREYLQNAQIWQEDESHHVAKLLTIGTPHGGSNQATFGIADGYSEGVRDLRWSYSNGAAGVYLFGGRETDLDPISFHNYDVNCNAVVGDKILGLNQKPIPNDLAYSIMIGTGGLSGDGVVDAARANLNNYYSLGADTFLVSALHTELTQETFTIMKGLDEPTYFNQSYRIGMDTSYYGLVTPQSRANAFTDDFDDFVIKEAEKASLRVQVGNIAVANLSVAIFDTSYSRIFIKSSSALSIIDTSVTLVAGKYYIEIQASPQFESWRFPYAIRLHSTPATSVDERNSDQSMAFRLEQNYPNPFNPSTEIRFSLPHTVYVSLKVYDVLGQDIATLISEEMTAGEHSVHWNASTNSSGTYFCRLIAGSYSETKKLLLVK